MTVPNVGSGTRITSVWGNAVADELNAATDFIDGCVERGTYTPTLSNCNAGTGGSASNAARYIFVGGTEVGDYGILVVSGRIVLGTGGGASMGTGPAATIPAGFNMEFEASTAAHRIGNCTAISTMGFVQRSSTTAVAFTVAGASGTYVANVSITSAVPGTWGAGDAITYNYAIGAVRV